METIFWIVGIILLILNIFIIVKFFQIAEDIRAIKNLYVDFKVEVWDHKLKEEEGVKTAYRFYKNPLNEISQEERENEYNKFIEETNKKRIEKEGVSVL